MAEIGRVLTEAEGGVEFHLLEIQQQNSASWRLLDSVASQRELVTKAHAGLFLVATYLTSLSISKLQVAVSVIVGGAIVTLISISSCFLAMYHRGLQFLVYSAERFSRHSLAKDKAFFSYLLSEPDMPSLRNQKDPMGYQLKAMLVIAWGDCVLEVGSITYSLISLGYASGLRTFHPVGLAIALLSGFAAGAALLVILLRLIANGERTITSQVRGEYQRLGAYFPDLKAAVDAGAHD